MIGRPERLERGGRLPPENVCVHDTTPLSPPWSRQHQWHQHHWSQCKVCVRAG
jgi:hypothetical protein